MHKQPTSAKLHEKPSLLCHLLLLSSSSASPFPSDVLAEWPQIHYIALSEILCDDIMSEQSKI